MSFNLSSICQGRGLETPVGKTSLELETTNSKYGRFTLRGGPSTFNLTGDEETDKKRADANCLVEKHVLRNVSIPSDDGTAIKKVFILFGVGRESNPCVTAASTINPASLTGVKCTCNFGTGDLDLSAARSSLLTSSEPSLKRGREDSGGTMTDDESEEGEEIKSDLNTGLIPMVQLTLHASGDKNEDLSKLLENISRMFEVGRKDPATGTFHKRIAYETHLPELCMPKCKEMVIIPGNCSGIATKTGEKASAASAVWSALATVGQAKNLPVTVAFLDYNHHTAFETERRTSTKMAKKAKNITLIQTTRLHKDHRCVIFDVGDRALITSILMRGTPCLLVATNFNEARLLSQNFGHLGSPTLKILSTGGYGIEIYPGRTADQARRINQDWINLVKLISKHQPTAMQIKGAIDRTGIYDEYVAAASNDPFFEGEMELEC